jgi:hypothetical protein
MREIKGNFWWVPCDMRVIATNGSCNRFGHAVMGRGYAAEAKANYPDLPSRLGARLMGVDSNHVYRFDDLGLVTFPVTHQWMEPTDISLIQRSALELRAMVNAQGWTRIVLPRVGCGNGHVQWTHIKPVLMPLWDDRFLICSWLFEG